MSAGFDSTIPELTRHRAMMREGSARLRAAIFLHFGFDPPAQPDTPMIKGMKVEPHEPLFGQLLLSVVAGEYGLSVQEVTGPRRLKQHIEVRALVADVLRHRNWPYPTIGRLLGKDHSSVIHSLGQLPRHLERSEKARAVHAALEQYRNPTSEDVA